MLSYLSYPSADTNKNPWSSCNIGTKLVFYKLERQHGSNNVQSQTLKCLPLIFQFPYISYIPFFWYPFLKAPSIHPNLPFFKKPVGPSPWIHGSPNGELQSCWLVYHHLFIGKIYLQMSIRVHFPASYVRLLECRDWKMGGWETTFLSFWNGPFFFRCKVCFFQEGYSYANS